MKFISKIKKHIFQKFKEYGVLKDIQPAYIPRVQMYDLYDTRINTEPFQVLAQELLSNQKFYNENKKHILDKIYHDMQHLNECMQPLKRIGINYSINLIGGAVRDYILDKHEQIKDLDIVIELCSSSYYNRGYTKQAQSRIFNKEKLEHIFSEEEFNAVNFDDQDTLYLKHNKLLQICLNRKTTTDHAIFFPFQDRVVGRTIYGESILQELSGIIKTKGGIFNYELDVLITDNNSKYLINTIDFNICNASIRFIDTSLPGYDWFAPYTYISDRFYSSVQFFEDIMNKTVTFNVKNKTYQQIEHSLTDHKERIMQKYPEYTLKVSGKHVGEMEQALIEKMMLSHELGDSLLVNSETKIKKTKI